MCTEEKKITKDLMPFSPLRLSLITKVYSKLFDAVIIVPNETFVEY